MQDHHDRSHPARARARVYVRVWGSERPTRDSAWGFVCSNTAIYRTIDCVQVRLCAWGSADRLWSVIR